MYLIKNIHGGYWNSENAYFGPFEAASLYETVDDLPDTILDLSKEVYATPDMGGSLDIRYFEDDAEDSFAGVVEL